MPGRFLGDWPKDAFLPLSQGMFFPSQVFTVIIIHTVQVPVLV
jgi:hypothetical protein